MWALMEKGKVPLFLEIHPKWWMGYYGIMVLKSIIKSLIRFWETVMSLKMKKSRLNEGLMNRNTSKCFPSLFLTLGCPYMLKNTLNPWTPDLDILQIFKCSSILSDVEKIAGRYKNRDWPFDFATREFSIARLTFFTERYNRVLIFVQYGYTAVK